MLCLVCLLLLRTKSLCPQNGRWLLWVYVTKLSPIIKVLYLRWFSHLICDGDRDSKWPVISFIIHFNNVKCHHKNEDLCCCHENKSLPTPVSTSSCVCVWVWSLHCCHPYHPCEFFQFLGAKFQVVGRLVQLSKMSILKIIQEVIIICEMLSSSVLHFSGSDPVTATSQSLHPLVFCYLAIKQKSRLY